VASGVLLYVAVPLTFITGVFRLLPVKNFGKDVATGFSLDLIFILPIFFLQALNNSTLQVEEVEKLLATDQLQFFAIIMKFAAALDIMLEMTMFCFEMYKLHNLERVSVDVVVRYKEEKRRQVYSSRYFKVAVSALVVLAGSIIATIIVLPASECRET